MSVELFGHRSESETSFKAPQKYTNRYKCENITVGTKVVYFILILILLVLLQGTFLFPFHTHFMPNKIEVTKD